MTTRLHGAAPTADETHRKTIRGLVLSFLGYVAYALSDASVRLLHGTVPPFELMFFGALIGFAAIPLVRQAGEGWRDLVTCRNRRMWLIRAAAAALGALSSVVAFTELPMAEAFALIFLLPSFVTILSVIFLKETVGWRRWSAVIFGFIGVLIVLRPGFHALKLGHVAALTSGFAGAVTIVVLRYLGHSEKRISLYGAGLIGPLAVGLAVSLPHFAWPPLRDLVFVLAYGLMGALGNVLMMVSSRLAPASILAPTQYSQMLWGIGLGYGLFGDHTDGVMILGAAIIIAAGLITFTREKAKLPQLVAEHPPVHPQ